MTTNNTQIIARYTAGTLLGLGSLTAISATISPWLVQPDVTELGTACIKAGMVVGTSVGMVVAVGYAHHRLQLWAALRPPDLRPAQMTQFLTRPAGPTLTTKTGQPVAARTQSGWPTQADATDAAQLAHEAFHAPLADDDEARWHLALTEFAFCSRWGGFGWQAMCRYVGRKDWKQCLAVMRDAGVLTESRGNIASDWREGWSYSRFRIDLKYRRLAINLPDNVPAPIVEWRKWLPTQRTQSARRELRWQTAPTSA